MIITRPFYPKQGMYITQEENQLDNLDNQKTENHHSAS